PGWQASRSCKMDDIDPVALQAAQEIAAEMAGVQPQPLDPAEAEARTAYWAEVRRKDLLELEPEAWFREQVALEQQRLAAEQEERSRLEHIRQQQRAQLERMRQQQAHQDAARAARAAADTRTALARQELERRQRVAIEEQQAFFRSLGPMGNPAPKPDPVLQRLDELEERLAEPEPTLLERLTRPFYTGPLLKDK